MLDFFKKFGRNTKTPPPVHNSKIKVNAEDAPDMTVIDPAAFKKQAQSLEFPVADCGGMANVVQYEDAAGDISERRLTFFSIQCKKGRYYLSAYCHERNAYRSFRCDRIIHCVDPETGEVREDFFNYMAETFAVEKERWLEGAQDTALEKCADGIRILVFLSRCDGEYHTLEREVIAEYVEARCGYFSLEFDMAPIMRFADRLRPFDDIFYEAIDSIIEEDSTDHIKLLTAKAVRLVEADGIIKPEEYELLQEMKVELDTE